MCTHREAPYRDSKYGDLRQSELAQDHAILLPIYAQMQDSDIEVVANALKKELCW
jgi:dTDP-4-amino-4,6-dideoxygalactose transaminase